MRRRIVVKHKNKTNKEESENTRFNEVRQFAHVLGAEGERVLIKPIDYMIQYQKSITPLFIGMESHKKRKLTTPNSDQKQIQKDARIRPESLCCRQSKGTLRELSTVL